MYEKLEKQIDPEHVKPACFLVAELRILQGSESKNEQSEEAGIKGFVLIAAQRLGP